MKEHCKIISMGFLLRNFTAYCPKCGCSQLRNESKNRYVCTRCHTWLEQCNCSKVLNFIASMVLLSPLVVLFYMVYGKIAHGDWPEAGAWLFPWVATLILSFVFKQRWNMMRVVKDKDLQKNKIISTF